MKKERFKCEKITRFQSKNEAMKNYLYERKDKK